MRDLDQLRNKIGDIQLPRSALLQEILNSILEGEFGKTTFRLGRAALILVSDLDK